MAIVVKSADQSRSNTTALTADSSLTATMQPNERWYIKAVLICSQPRLGAGARINVTIPAGATSICAENWWLQTRDSTNSQNLGEVPVGTSRYIQVPPSGDDPLTYKVSVEFLVKNGGSAGDVSIVWAQDVASAVATTIVAESFMRAEKV